MPVRKSHVDSVEVTRSRADRQPRPAPDRGRRRLHEGVARLLHHGAHGGHRPRELLGHPLLDLPEPLLRHLRLRDLRLAHDRGPGQDASRAGVLCFSLLARANRGAAPTQSSARTRSSCSRRRTCATASCACARTRSRSRSTAARPARPRRSARASTAPWRTSARSWARSGTSSSSRRRTRTSCRSCPCSSCRRSTSRARSSSAS